MLVFNSFFFLFFSFLFFFRSFPDLAIGHVEGSVDPIRDLEIIFAELMEKDKEGLKEMMKRVGKSRDPDKVREGEVGKKVVGMLEKGEDLRAGIWDKSEVEIINRLVFFFFFFFFKIFFFLLMFFFFFSLGGDFLR